MVRRRLAVRAETIRAMTAGTLARARGGYSATDGAGNCVSELSDCPTHAWSCINMSCTLKGGDP